MTMPDIEWNSEHGGFFVRVAGVCIQRDHVLLTHREGANFWYLPGGLCMLFEKSNDALAREMQEELGVTVQVGRLLWTIENCFDLSGRHMHEVGFLYQFFLPPGSSYDDTAQTYFRPNPGGAARDVFRWFPLAGLRKVRLFPGFLRTGLLDLPATPRHLTNQDAIDAGHRDEPPAEF
jgi:8-oxo-dGTP pyrophosphatase MutT (NUDIX family)